MIYKTTIKTNPKILLLFLIMAVLLAAGILTMVILGILPGIIILVIAVYLDYHLVKFIRLQLNSYIKETSEGIECLTTTNEKIYIPWDEINYSGTFNHGSQEKRYIFVYSDEQDQLLTIPDEYENIDKLLSSLSNRFSLLHLNLDQHETIQDKLKEIISDNTGSTG